MKDNELSRWHLSGISPSSPTQPPEQLFPDSTHAAFIPSLATSKVPHRRDRGFKFVKGQAGQEAIATEENGVPAAREGTDRARARIKLCRRPRTGKASTRIIESPDEENRLSSAQKGNRRATIHDEAGLRIMKCSCCKKHLKKPRVLEWRSSLVGSVGHLDLRGC